MPWSLRTSCTQLLKKAAGCKVIEIASESEFADKFPDCEAGAMPPFGNLYEMDVFVDERLSNDNEGLRSLIFAKVLRRVSCSPGSPLSIPESD